MIDFIMLGKWVVGSILQGWMYQQFLEQLGNNKFKSLTQKSLNKILKKEDNKIIWNEILEMQNLEIKDPTNFDYNQVCNSFSGEYLAMCRTFFRELRREYFKQLCKVAETDPVLNYLMKDIFEERILFEERFEDTKQLIQMKKADVKDFVGRKDIIENFPSGDVFIQGKAAFGKTYLMLLLCKLFNGYYIPLGTIKDIQIFKYLLKEAKLEKKRIFLDDFHLASKEIDEYIRNSLIDIVIASREEFKTDRQFNLIPLNLLDKNDIKDYFSNYHIKIDNKALESLQNDLNFPIKLRIFVDYLKRKNITNLDIYTLEKLMEKMGLKKFKLPDELNEFYNKFVFGLFGKKQVDLCYILSLLRSPASIGQISKISGFSTGEVTKLLEKMMGILEFHENRYEIFHESFKEFCIANLGDIRELNKKIGNYFKIFIEIEGELETKIEAMYHFRISESKNNFNEVFNLAIIQFLIKNGQWQEALDDLKFELTLQIDKKIKADSIRLLGTIYTRISDWKNALFFLKKSREIYTNLRDFKGLAQTYNNLGTVYYHKNKWKNAILYHEKSLKISKKIEDNQLKAKNYNNLGLIYYKMSEWDNAVKYYNKSIRISKKLGQSYGMALALDNLGSVYYKMSEWNKAEKCHIESLEIFKNHGYIHEISQTYNDLGLIYYSKNELDIAIEYYKKSLEIKEKLEDKHGIAQNYNNLGMVYAKKEKFDVAIEYYEKSLEIKEKLEDRYGIAQTYNNLGSVFRKKGEFKKAICFINLGLIISRELNDHFGISQNYINLGLIYKKKGRIKKFIEYYEKSLKIKKKIGDRHGIAHIYDDLGSLYYEKHKYERAINYYQKALLIFQEIKDKIALEKTKYSLSKCYREINKNFEVEELSKI